MYTDCTGICKSNYHMIATKTTPFKLIQLSFTYYPQIYHILTLIDCFAKRQKMKMTLYRLFTSLVIINLSLPCTNSILEINCIDRIHFFIPCHWTKYSFCWYPCYMLPGELREPSCISSSLPVDRKYQKRQSRDNCIIVLFIRECCLMPINFSAIAWWEQVTFN